jgi:two-component system chemotaxis response regulator CheY
MKLRALVVDDSRVMRNLVMQSVRKTELAEFEFIEAEDGSDALGKFNPKAIDIMFVDWNMPKMTGIDFVRKVRATGKTEHIPIVMVTSEKSMGKMQDALDSAGANEYITKPFGPDELSRKLTKLIAGIPSHKSEDAAGKSGGFFGKLFGGT